MWVYHDDHLFATPFAFGTCTCQILQAPHTECQEHLSLQRGWHTPGSSGSAYEGITKIGEQVVGNLSVVESYDPSKNVIAQPSDAEPSLLESQPPRFVFPHHRCPTLCP